MLPKRRGKRGHLHEHRQGAAPDDFHLCPDSGGGGMRIYLCGGSYLGNGGVFQTIKLGTTDLKKYATIN